jgi:competence protein ComEC
LEYLTDAKQRQLDLVVLTHADKDHIGGLGLLLDSQNVKIKSVIVNTDSLQGSAAWRDLLFQLGDARRRGKLAFSVGLTSSSTLPAIGDFAVQVLAPSPDLMALGPGSRDRDGRHISTNSVSAVMRLVHNGNPLLFVAGDLDDVGLADLEREMVNAVSQVAVCPHHGGATNANPASFVQRLARLVSPRTVIFSIGRGRFNNPDPNSMAAWRREAPRARMMCTQLSEHCAAALPTAPATHLSRAFSQGRDTGKCCAGTVVLRPSQKGVRISPGRTKHHRFIKACAPTALCTRRA